MNSADCKGRLTFDLESDAGGRTVELPFVVGVLADLGGQRAPASGVAFRTIDRRQFDAVLAEMAPRLSLTVPDHLQPGGAEVEVSLCFRCLADFHPIAVANQVPALRQLLARRRELARSAPPPQTSTPSLEALGDLIDLEIFEPAISPVDEALADLDTRLTLALCEIVHHPQFQRLEASWRGLYYLVQQAEAASVEIRVLDCTKAVLLADLADAAASRLHERLAAEFEPPAGMPVGLLLADFAFGPDEADRRLAEHLAALGAALAMPVVASADPRMIGLDRFSQLRTAPGGRQTLPADSPWQAFRQSDAARYLALSLPRVLGRLPYADDFQRIDDFPFDEFLEGRHHGKLLWLNAGWAVAGRIVSAVARHGWPVGFSGLEAGPVDDLPGLTFRSDEGELAANCATEIALGGRRAAELAERGLLPLAYSKSLRGTYLPQATTCHEPPPRFEPLAHRQAQQQARLDDTLCRCRFLQGLRRLERELVRTVADAAQRERCLNNWIQTYVLADPAAADELTRARRPLAEARVQLRPVRGAARHELVADLVLHPLDPPAATRRVA
jgi:type VI secretion system protein ImpC